MIKTVLTLTLLLILNTSFSQELFDGFREDARGANGIRVAFYNVENLFDTEDDSLKNDAEFLPEGNKYWNTYRYWTKQKQIAKTISALGGWEAPAIVGLAEIENKHTLINLVQHTPLKKHNYGIVHFESPDKRGIDVALLYRREKIDILESKAIEVRFSDDLGARPTRDILYVKVQILGEDTIHIFVNHWPSRWGGQMQTEPKRMFVASLLKKHADSLLNLDPKAAILIMGDLNDTPQDLSIIKSLGASLDSLSKSQYYNLCATSKAKGSHYYQGGWSFLDQIIVSPSLLNKNAPVHLQPIEMTVFRAPFLLEENSQGEFSPNRTYLGMKYHGGYSDHLPVFVDLYLKSQ